MEIQLKLNADRLTLDELVDLESGSYSATFMRNFLSRFVIDENGEFMAENEARKIVGKLTLTQLQTVVNDFTESIKGLQAAAVPPESGGA